MLVCAPRLLDADCKSVEQMRLVNAVCRFVELAEQRPVAHERATPIVGA